MNKKEEQIIDDFIHAVLSKHTGVKAKELPVSHCPTDSRAAYISVIPTWLFLEEVGKTVKKLKKDKK